MKKLLLIVLFAGGVVHATHAQMSKGVENPKIGFAIQPMVFFLGGLQVDIQPYLKPRHQLVIAPQLYYINNTKWLFNDVDLEQLRGVGLDLTYRIFPREEKPFYAGFGAGYNFYKPKYYTNDAAIPTQPNGAIEFGRALNEQNINRLSVNVIMGWQEETSYGFFLDFYGGLGFRYGVANKLYDDDISFNSNMWSMAYQGIYLVLGMKIGFEL